MKDFQYLAPHTLREAVALLAEKGAGARALAGGTDLLVQLRNRRFVLERVVDVKNIPELNELSFGPRRGLRIGAAVSCRRLYSDAEVVQRYPGLVDAVAIIGGIQIQGRASLGGNVCNASPSADGVPPLIVHGAVAEIVGPEGRRRLPVEKFCTGPGENALQSGELLVALTLPLPRRATGAHYLRFIPRREMDIAVVGVGAQVELADRRRIFKSVRLALGAVAPVPLFVRQVGELLAGREVDETAIEAAAQAAQEAARPISDMRGPADFRRHLVGVLTRRALRGAIDRACGRFVANAVQDPQRAAFRELIHPPAAAQ